MVAALALEWTVEVRGERGIIISDGGAFPGNGATFVENPASGFPRLVVASGSGSGSGANVQRESAELRREIRVLQAELRGLFHSLGQR
jgi:hypothetical protein